MSITHATTATGTDAGTGDIHKAEWNATHTVTDGIVFLASSVLGSAAADITLTGLSGAYTDLIVVARFRSTNAGAGLGLQMRVGNGSIDTGSNYAYSQRFEGWTSGNNQSASASTINAGTCPNSGATAGYFGGGRWEILDYASSTRTRSVIGTCVSVDGSGILRNDVGALWLNHAAAIDQISIYASAGNLDTGSSIFVYGRF